MNFKRLGDINKAKISAFSDASHAYLNVIFLHGENNHAAPISWRSRTIN